MAKTNRTCYVCNSTYYYCPTCTPTDATYKTMFCSSDCKHIWDVLSKHGVGLCTSRETLTVLNKCKLPRTLVPAIRKHIREIQMEVRADEAAQAETIEE